MQVDTGDDGDGDHGDDGGGDRGDDGDGDDGDGDHGDVGDGDHDGYEDVVGVCSAETVGMECLHKLGLIIPRLRSAAITLCSFQTKLINLSTLFSNADCLILFLCQHGCWAVPYLNFCLCLFVCFFRSCFCPVE